MRLVIIALGLFFSMKLVYGFMGDYSSDYWSTVYYIANYFLMTSLMWYMYVQAHSILQRYFFMLGVVYFFGLLVLHIVCLFRIELYTSLVSQVGYYGIGAIILTIGILYIKFKRHARKIRTKNLMDRD